MIWKKILVSAVIILAINSSFNFVVHNILKVPKGEIQEALSIVFQQTARYVSEYPDDVTEEEKEAIDTVLPYDKISESYDPELADSIKGKMKEGVSHSGYLNYALTWLKMGLKKPDVYIQATLNNTYGYFYPLFSPGVYQTGINHTQTERWGTEELDIYYISENRAPENAVFRYVMFLDNLPVIGLVFNPGFYFWLMLLLIAFAIYCKNNEAITMVLYYVLTFLICYASPINGNSRYILVVYATAIMVTISVLHYSAYRNVLKCSEEVNVS